MRSHDANGSGQSPVLLTAEDTPNFMNLPLEYRGFCPWTVTNRNGLLLPGDPNLGVVSYRNTYSVFHSQEGLKEFMRNPEAVNADLIAEARRHPELIHLLELQSYFPQTAMYNFLRSSRTTSTNSTSLSQNSKIVSVDACTETPTHFVERHIDPSYDWNEWSIRRKALQLVNLRKAKTSSTQTIKSHFRRENNTQVFKECAYITMTYLSSQQIQKLNPCFLISK